MEIKRNDRNTKQAREIQNMVMQLIQLWIDKLEFENEEDRLRKEISDWERENDELKYGEEQFEWGFTWEHI